jgi:hypothetical protein
MLVFLTFFNGVFSGSLLSSCLELSSSDRLTMSEDVEHDVQLRFNFFLEESMTMDSSARICLLFVVLDVDVLDEPLVDGPGCSEFLASTSLTTDSGNCLTTTLSCRKFSFGYSLNKRSKSDIFPIITNPF